MFGGVDLPRSAGPWVPACAGMTGEVVGCSGEWTCLGVRAVGSRPGSWSGASSAREWTDQVVGCSGEWTSPRVGAVGSRPPRE